jgi:ribonuclease P protein component
VAQGLKAGRPSCLIQMRARGDGLDAVNIGYTASKKVGGAVQRNRAKRRLREAARLLLPPRAEPGCDYVFIANARTADVGWSQLLDDVTAALQRLARLREASKAAEAAQPPENP